MRKALSAIIIATTVLVSGCGDETPANEQEETDHEHQHVQGPNGGDLVSVGDGAGKLEWMAVHDEGVLVLWCHTADPAPQPLTLDGPPTLACDHDGKPVKITAEKFGDHEWRFEHEVFGSAFSGGTITVQIGGTSHDVGIHHH